GYFTVESSEVEQKKGKRGRGAAGKQNVAVMAESTQLEDQKTGNKSSQVRYFKAKVLKSHQSNEINETIEESTKETLKWVHIFISNAKRNLLGNYHKIKGKYLQAYLNEFVYKLNRRYFGEKLFDRLIIAAINSN
ncbi:transposase, partial [Jejuia pallidilutea]|uniref:transposase n=2 Tax=Jejuia pallidilutea TaxID=504487 RepID=UPI0005EF190B